MGMIQDGGGAGRAKTFPASWDMVAKPCDYCKSAAALLFCRDDSAFICISCDANVHDVNQKHERVWICEVCEQAPAVVTCKADAASLCLTCDRDIHSANPLARRHDRTPIVPFHDTAESVVLKSTADHNLLVPINNDGILLSQNDYLTTTTIESWIPTNNNSIVTGKLSDDARDIKSIEFLLSDSDQFLDFENYQISSHTFSDSVVPVQTVIKQQPVVQAHSTNDNSSGNLFEIDFTRSNLNSYNNSYTTASSLSHSVSSSSMEMGIVPDGSAMSDISYPFARNVGSIADLGGNQSFPVVVGLDREARVLRYREKRKNRKFQKTIRYASRKAYAESRPRIKGRFAKRNDGEPDIDGIFMSCDPRYGVVPSF